MSSTRVASTLVLVATVIGAFGAPGPSTLADANLAIGGQPLQEQTTAETCDFVELYEETRDAVVVVAWDRGQGSGFFYDVPGVEEENYVVTNHHVVGDAREVLVAFRGNETRIGTVIGTDASADLAMVRVDDPPEYATPLRGADSEPRPGQQVAAIGSPFGLQGTITHGIVSAVDRTIPNSTGEPVLEVVQTDAPINPGSSGGPLVACDGSVVGVNTAGLRAGIAENVGFAVSISLVDDAAPEVVEAAERGEAERRDRANETDRTPPAEPPTPPF